MNALKELEADLERLIEAGKRNSSLDEKRIRQIKRLCQELLDEMEEEPARESLREADLPASCYAYVPDPDRPSTWKLPYKNADGSIDEAHLAAAAAAFSPGGHRGKKVEIPAGEIAAVKKKLVAAYHKLGKKDSDIPSQLLEADGPAERVELTRVTPLTESEHIADDGTIKIQIIKPGWGNKRDNHYYPQKTLERDHAIFQGLKMYCDHATLSEERQRPERSLRDWVATVKETWVDNTGIVWGRAKVHAGWFRDLIREAGEEIGISINALGDVRKGVVGDRRGGIVEALVRGKSVDFVTQAGAGGRVTALYESARKEDANMFDTMTDEEILAGLKESRESVITQLREEMKGDIEEMLRKTIEAEMQEKGDDPVDDKGELQKLQEADRQKTAEIEELRKELSVRATREAVAEALAGSKLPEVSKARVREAFADRTYDQDADRETAIKSAIEAEVRYVKELGGPVIKGMGESSPEAVKEAQQDMDRLLGIEPKEKEE